MSPKFAASLVKWATGSTHLFCFRTDISRFTPGPGGRINLPRPFLAWAFAGLSASIAMTYIDAEPATFAATVLNGPAIAPQRWPRHPAGPPIIDCAFPGNVVAFGLLPVLKRLSR